MFSISLLKINGLGTQIKFLFVHAGRVFPNYLLKSIEFLVANNTTSDIDIILTHQPKTSIVNKVTKLDNVNLVIKSSEKYDVYKERLDRFYPNQVSNRFWFFSVLRLLLIEDWAKTVEGPFIHLESDCLFLLTENQIKILFENHKKLSAPFDRDGRCVPSLIYFPNKIEAIHLGNFIRKILEDGSSNWPNFYLSDQELLTFAFNEGLIYALPSEPVNRSNDFVIGENFVLFDPAYIGQYLLGKDPKHNFFIRRGGWINPAGDTRFVTNSIWRIDNISQSKHNLKVNHSNHSFIIANLHNYAKVTKFLPNLNTRYWTSALIQANKNRFPIGKIDFGMLFSQLVSKLFRNQL